MDGVNYVDAITCMCMRGCASCLHRHKCINFKIIACTVDDVSYSPGDACDGVIGPFFSSYPNYNFYRLYHVNFVEYLGLYLSSQLARSLHGKRFFSKCRKLIL